MAFKAFLFYNYNWFNSNTTARISIALSAHGSRAAARNFRAFFAANTWFSKANIAAIFFFTNTERCGELAFVA